MKILITGIHGFVGHYLTRELLHHGHQVFGLDRHGSDIHLQDTHIPCMAADILSPQKLQSAMEQISPEACIHLAAVASPPVGNRNPQLMLDTNVLGTQFLLQALQSVMPDCRFLLASTAYVYGRPPGDTPISETTPMRPQGIYALSKAAAELATLASAEIGMQAMTVRAANHTGPGQDNTYVVPAFAEQVKHIAEGHSSPVIRVGNLASERSFLDVRDVVRAYRLILEQGHAGQAYNVGSPDRIPMQHVLDQLASLARVDLSIEVDPERYRPTDQTPILDCALVHEHTGWKPAIPLHQTLREVLDACTA